MQHPCSRCGAAVDDNSAFCPTCEAPQITFIPRELDPEMVRLHPEMVPPAPPLFSSRPPPPHVEVLTRNRAVTLRSAAYAAAVGVLLSLLPFGGPVFGLPVAGWLAARFYTRFSRAGLRPSAGFRVGAIAGLMVFAVFIFLASLSVALSTRDEVHQALTEVANRTHAINPDFQPELFVNFVMTPAGAMALAIIFCLMSVILSGLGGLISALISQRRSNR